MDNNSLTHHGIKGQRWGIRRFQTKSGSLTALGRKRYSDDSDGGENNQKGSGSKGGSSSGSSKPKSIGEMNNDELREAITNLQLQRQYKQLVSEMNPQKVSKGKEFIRGFVDRALVPAIQEGGRQLIRDAMVNAGKKTFGLDGDTTDAVVSKMKKKVEVLELENKLKKLKNPDDDQDSRISKLEKNIREKELTNKSKQLDDPDYAREEAILREGKLAEAQTKIATARKNTYNTSEHFEKIRADAEAERAVKEAVKKVDKDTPVTSNVMDAFAEHKKTQEIVNKALNETLSSLDTVMGSTFVDDFR